MLSTVVERFRRRPAGPAALEGARPVAGTPGPAWMRGTQAPDVVFGSDARLLNAPMVLGVLGAVEAALTSMGAPTAGSGVAAAAVALGDALRS